MRVLILVLIFISTPAYAWTKADTQRQLVYSVLHVIDWGQTRDVVLHGYPERNLFLGNYPSTQQVDNYFALTLIGHSLIAYYLPDSYRKQWQSITIGFEIAIVMGNYSVGINVHY